MREVDDAYAVTSAGPGWVELVLIGKLQEGDFAVGKVFRPPAGSRFREGNLVAFLEDSAHPAYSCERKRDGSVVSVVSFLVKESEIAGFVTKKPQPGDPAEVADRTSGVSA